MPLVGDSCFRTPEAESILRNESGEGYQTRAWRHCQCKLLNLYGLVKLCEFNSARLQSKKSYPTLVGNVWAEGVPFQKSMGALLSSPLDRWSGAMPAHTTPSNIKCKHSVHYVLCIKGFLTLWVYQTDSSHPIPEHHGSKLGAKHVQIVR